MDGARVLVLGGTSEARALAQTLQDGGVPFVSSLAGRVSSPRLPVGEVRIGGFGGVEGLTRTLRSDGFTHVVDATHPFAIGMRQNATAAAHHAGLPILRLARPGWRQRPDATSWHWVADYAEADGLTARLGRRPFITSGRQTLDALPGLRELPCLVRVVEPLDPDSTPSHWTVVLDRGPFEVQVERELMRKHRVDVLVTKDSGGSYTSAKLDAAAELGVPVVVVSRPRSPEGLSEVSTVETVIEWLDSATTP